MAKIIWDNEISEQNNALGILIKNRDESALEHFMYINRPWVIRKALQRLGNAEDAEDVASLFYARIWEKSGKWDQTKGTFSKWAYRVFKNILIDMIRTKLRYKRIFPTVSLSDTNLENDPDIDIPVYDKCLTDELYNENLIEYLEDAAMKLTPKQRIVFILRYLEEYSIWEVAEILQMQEGAVRTTYHRAIRNLQTILKGLYEVITTKGDQL